LKPPFLSIIIPAYNEASRLPNTLLQIDAFINTQPYQAEIIVVENGSSDDTLMVARQMMGKVSNLKVLHEEKRGKGWAVRRGMHNAWGDYRFICDADLSMPIEELPRFFPPQLLDAAIAIASREAPGAQRFNEPQYRHLIGRVFNGLVRLLLLPGLQDTQCGFKCFRSDAAKRIFPLLTVKGWTFDAEALFIARRLGYSIQEIPIPWHHHPHSNIRVLRDSLQMGRDVLRIRWNALKGIYRIENENQSPAR